MKRCTVCGVDKPTSEFFVRNASPDGLNPKCKPCTNEHNRRWKLENTERHQFLQRRSWLKQNYNLTTEDYDDLLRRQSGACAICGGVSTERLKVDHDHSCCPGRTSCGGCVRGLLCGPCNRLLGWFDNNRDAIEAYTRKAVSA